MSVLAIPLSVSNPCPAGYEPRECHVCNCGIFIRSSTADTPTCDHCRRALIEGEFGRIKGDVLDIINGKGEWTFADPKERQRFLNELRAITFKLIAPPDDAPVGAREFPAGRREVPTPADICAMLDTEEEGVEVAEAFEQW